MPLSEAQREWTRQKIAEHKERTAQLEAEAAAAAAAAAAAKTAEAQAMRPEPEPKPEPKARPQLDMHAKTTARIGYCMRHLKNYPRTGKHGDGDQKFVEGIRQTLKTTKKLTDKQAKRLDAIKNHILGKRGETDADILASYRGSAVSDEALAEQAETLRSGSETKGTGPSAKHTRKVAGSGDSRLLLLVTAPNRIVGTNTGAKQNRPADPRIRG